MANQTFSAICLSEGQRIAEPEFQPGGTFSEADFQETVADPMLASLDHAIQSYSDLEEKIARCMTQYWILFGKKEDGAKQYVGWLLRFGDLAQANGRIDEMAEYLKNFLLKKMNNDQWKNPFRSQLISLTEMILDSCKLGEAPNVEQVRDTFPSLFDAFSGEKPLA